MPETTTSNWVVIAVALVAAAGGIGVAVINALSDDHPEGVAITALDCSGPVAAGGQLVLRYSISSTGDEMFWRDLGVDFYVSEDDVRYDDTVDDRVAIIPGEPAVVTRTFTVPSDVLPGQYHVRGEVWRLKADYEKDDPDSAADCTATVT